MGDRHEVVFDNGACIYLHWGISREELQAFLDEDKGQRDSRITDPSYLAARFVAWCASRMWHGSCFGVGLGIQGEAGKQGDVWRIWRIHEDGSIEDSEDSRPVRL